MRKLRWGQVQDLSRVTQHQVVALAEPQALPGSCPFTYALQGAGRGGLSPPYRFILGISME